MAKNKPRKPRSNAAARNKAALVNTMINVDMARAYTKGMNNGYGVAVLVMLWLLHEKHGFGKKRLAVFMRAINDFCLENIAPGPDGTAKPKEGEFSGISLKDIADTLAEECGVFIDTETWMMEVKGVEVRRIKAEGQEGEESQ